LTKKTPVKTVDPTWAQRVRAIAYKQLRSIGDIERESGWAKNRLSSSLNKGSCPDALSGIRLAKSLGVSADWLFDDTNGEDNICKPAPRLVKDIDRFKSIIRMMATAIDLLGIDTGADTSDCLKRVEVMARDLHERINKVSAFVATAALSDDEFKVLESISERCGDKDAGVGTAILDALTSGMEK